VALAVALGGCSPRDPHRATVLYASGADLQSISPLVAVHPLAKQVQNHVLFLTLAVRDSALQPVPRLATWAWDDARTTLRFDLRRDVTWHDGVATTADDVAWTLQRARDPAVAYPRASELRDLATIVREDSFSVTLHFRAPQPTFPDALTDLAILPSHLLGTVPLAELRTHPFNRAPVGNGPFAFVEYRPNQRWVFRRYDGFPADLGRPAIERLVVVVVDEPATKLAALTSGELDFAGISPAHAEFVRDNPRLRVIDYPIPLSYAVIFNLRRPPFDDVRVRRALSRAVDRETIIEGSLYGFGSPAAGPVHPDHPWAEPIPPVEFDPGEARRLLDEAGWGAGADGIRRRDGRRLEFDLLTVGSGDLALEQMLEAQWRAVGAAVRIRRVELSTFLGVAQGPARDFDALVTGIPGVLSLGHVAALYDGDGPLAYAGYEEEGLRAAFAGVRDAVTAESAEGAWRAVQAILAWAEPSAWLYHARGVQGAARRIAGVRMDLRGELAGIASWTVDQPEEDR
jgi:peptide/nickel transport system substrate-binding protein